MITIEHKEEYINGEKVEDYYIIEKVIFKNYPDRLFGLSLKDLQELYDKIGEIINNKP